MNGIFMKLAVWLTHRENHRYESEYEESLIAKLFLFQFMNSYAMLFYIAFFRSMVGDECDGGEGCMGELSLALFVIFGNESFCMYACPTHHPFILSHSISYAGV